MNREQTKLMITDVIQRVGVRVVLEAVEEWARLNSDMGYDGDDVTSGVNYGFIAHHAGLSANFSDRVDPSGAEDFEVDFGYGDGVDFA